MSSQSAHPRRGLTLDTLNPHLIAAEYAVRGELASRSEKYRVLLEKNGGSGAAVGLPFDSVISANIGNPQQLDQKPITFFRQVTSLVENPGLLEHQDVMTSSMGYKSDVFDRARWLLEGVKSVGAYSQSNGNPGIRQSIANFIQDRDGHAADPNHIFLTAGASAGVSTMLHAICSSPTTGVLIPIPQYPLYTASLTLLNAQAVSYYLDESSGWATSISEIQNAYRAATEAGTDVRALVVINPGNPTGATLSVEMIEKLILFAAKEKLVILADEVYQTNVFTGSFVSFKKVLRDMQARSEADGVGKDLQTIQLASLHSISKGMVGECGHRGGYFELVGFSTEVVEQVYKYISIQLCPSVVGQCVVEMMVNPPKEGEPSYPLYRQEIDSVYDNLKERAYALWNAFKQMEGVECLEPAGAMYLFPTIHLPAKAVEAAGREHLKADAFYCSRLLDATGICVVPGSGFGQRENTLHFRTTFLAPGTAWTDRWIKFHHDFMNEFRD